MLDTGTAFAKTGHHYIGVCSDIEHKRSGEAPLDSSVGNFKKHFYTDGGNDATKIMVSASAGYPFLEPVSPNIGFELKIELHKNLSGRSIDVHVSGRHNGSPAYELVINEGATYPYGPADCGHTAPSMVNLNSKKHFSATKWIRSNDREAGRLEEKNTFGR